MTANRGEDAGPGGPGSVFMWEACEDGAKENCKAREKTIGY